MQVRPSFGNNFLAFRHVKTVSAVGYQTITPEFRTVYSSLLVAMVLSSLFIDLHTFWLHCTMLPDSPKLHRKFELISQKHSNIQKRQDKIDNLAENMLFKMDTVLSKLKSVQERFEALTEEDTALTPGTIQGT